VLLTALVQAFSACTGESSLVVHLEGHGREEIIEGIDVSRTVGWFTTMFPVLLEKSDTEELFDTLKAVKETLRNIPHRGIGYGLLKYLRGDKGLAQKLRSQSQPEIGFNYLGQFDQVLGENPLFAPARESVGPTSSPDGTLAHLLEINGSISDGQLIMAWRYSENLFRRDTIEKLSKNFLKALRVLIARSHTETLGYTPADFPLARIDQPSLDHLVNREGPFQDLYQLSPLQQGLLFHNLYAPKSSLYYVQQSCTFKGGLNVEALKRAWQTLIDRHTILRTAFVWEGLEKHLQMVLQQVELPWQDHDWRGLSSAAQQERWEALLKDDRELGFDPTVAPLLRLRLVRLNDQEYNFFWSTHHLLLDGWSGPILMREALALYDAFDRGEECKLPVTRPFRDYIAWLMDQNIEPAEVYWREKLRGFHKPTTLSIDRLAKGPVAEPAYAQEFAHLPEEAMADLRGWAQQQQLTLNTVMLGAWALVLGRYSGRDDVVFGTVVAGRPNELKGSDEMVGVFINTLPMRVSMPADAFLVEWLRMLQVQHSELRQYEYSPLVEIQNWSEIPRGLPLFETLLNFTNYPTDQSLRRWSGAVSVHNLRTYEKASYALALVADARQRLDLEFKFDSSRFGKVAVAHLLDQLSTLLVSFSARSDAQLSDLLEVLNQADKQQQVLRQKLFKDTRRKVLENVKAKGYSKVKL